MEKQTFNIRDLAGPWLDYAVFLSEQRSGIAVSKPVFVLAERADTARDWFSPSMKQEHGGPIIDRAGISTVFLDIPRGWRASMASSAGIGYLDAGGPTRLIAAMRCYALRSLGDLLIVELP